MDQLSVVFQLSVFALCCLGSVMLAVADAAAFPYVLTVPFAIVALVITEFRRSFRLGTAWSNLFGTISLGYAIVRMFPLFVHLLKGRGLPEQGVAHEIIVAAHLLVFLSWIVFFMPKRPREYWAMCTLSVLQVAIGAILTSSGTYGILLGVYVFLGIWTLSIFSIEQTRWQVAEDAQTEEWLRFGPEPKTKSPSEARSGSNPAANALDGYWKRPSRSQGTIQIDPHERWISGRFIAGMFATAVVSILISGLFVVFTPRVWAGRGPLFTQSADTEGIAQTGFTESVKLGGESRIKESNDLVMEVRLVNDETGEKIEVEDYARTRGQSEPLFQGSFLETYENSGWTTRLDDGHEFGTQGQGRQRRRPANLVREEIRLQPTGSGVLIAMGPLHRAVIEDREYTVFTNLAGTLMRFRPTVSELGRIYSASASYTQEVTGIPWTKPLEMTALTYETMTADPPLSRHIDLYRQFPPRGLDRLRTLAREVADKARADGAANDAEVAKALEKYFLNTGEFIYTLELERRDLDIDPLEDFVFNTRAGHCEYYASALAMMLRAAGIPSRLVSGFKGGDVNKFSGSFEVRQLHAHAWVEAFVDGKNWITLDPTPAREIRTYGGNESSYLNWQDFKTFVEGLWSGYVTNADITKQRARIYEPIAKKFREWGKSISGQGKDWSDMAVDLWLKLRSPENWFSWQGGLIAAVISATIALLIWGLKGSIARLRRLWQYLFQRRHQHSAIAFYERFRKICRARGLEREPSQTQREFVTRVHQSLNDLLASVGLGAFPRHLVDGFYQVRFGGIPLDAETASQIDHNLTLLEQSLKQQKRR